MSGELSTILFLLLPRWRGGGGGYGIHNIYR